MNNAFKKIILGLYLAVLFIPAAVSADGMIITPPNFWGRETDQKAAIFYDQGIETMVVSIKFEGNAKDFGWIIPVPNKPTVTKGSQKLFTALAELTQAQLPTRAGLPDMSQGLGGAQKQPVTVVEEKTIEYYDVKILTSTDKEALTKWFKDNNFNFPETASYILDSYINNNWYFVAMKISPESSQSQTINQELKSGTATPVSLSFKAEHLVYPLRISSVVTEESAVNKELVLENGTNGTNHNDDSGTPGNWDGCRGTGLSVCVEAVGNLVGSNQEVEKYFNEHPDCIKNYTCGGEYFTCNAKCPPPGKKFAPSPILKMPSYYYPSVSVLLYIFADHKKEISDFDAIYANWLGKKDIEKLATNDQGDPWIQPKKSKYFLTTLYRSMNYSQMNEDLFPQNAKDNKKLVPGQEEPQNKPLFSLLGVLIIFILFSLVFLSPPAVLFVACALIQFFLKKKIGHIIAWILQGMVLCFYLLVFIQSLIFVVQPIAMRMESQQLTGMLTNISSGNPLTNLDSFSLLIPIFVGLAIIAMVITIIYQIRSPRNKKISANITSPSQKDPSTLR